MRGPLEAGPGRRWKICQTAILFSLALSAGGTALLCLLDGMGFTLVVGQMDSGHMIWCLLLVFLLALLAWGDGAIVMSTEGWVRGLMLTAALAAEGLVLTALLLFGAFFNTSPRYIPLYGPAGEVELVVREESWLFSVQGEFYQPAGPCLLRSTGVTYAAHDCWPFSDSRCHETEWSDESVTVHYDTGMGEWETCTVPLTVKKEETQ